MVASTGMASDNLAGTAPSTTTRAPGIDNINSSTSNPNLTSNPHLPSNPNLPPSTSTTSEPGPAPSSSYTNNVDAATHTCGEKQASMSSNANADGPSGVKKFVSKIGEKLSAGTSGSSGSADRNLSSGSAMQGATGHDVANSARHPDQGLGHGHAGSNLNRE